MKCGRSKATTPVKKDTLDPTFASRVCLFVKNPDTSSIVVQVCVCACASARMSEVFDYQHGHSKWSGWSGFGLTTFRRLNVHMHTLNTCEVIVCWTLFCWAVWENSCPSLCKFDGQWCIRNFIHFGYSIAIPYCIPMAPQTVFVVSLPNHWNCSMEEH